MTLEERIERLEDIEAIRYLQAKYQRLLDTRAFNELATLFAEDAVCDYDNGKMHHEGKDEIVKFLCRSMSISMPSTHLIHGGEIDIIDNKNAVAKWYLEDHLEHERYLLNLHGAAIYEIKYVKVDSFWLIKKIGYTRTYQRFEFRPLLNLLTLSKKTYLERIKKSNIKDLSCYDLYFKDKKHRK